LKVFIDTSVVIAACGRLSGASRLVFDSARKCNWILQSSNYSNAEIERNIVKLPVSAQSEWHVLRARLESVPDVVTFPWITVFTTIKDRPILFTAATHSHVLLTLDRRDFIALLGTNFYGLSILSPGAFLKAEDIV
jgi:predicted nucleic acid-binding protein